MVHDRILYSIFYLLVIFSGYYQFIEQFSVVVP